MGNKYVIGIDIGGTKIRGIRLQKKIVRSPVQLKNFITKSQCRKKSFFEHFLESLIG